MRFSSDVGVKLLQEVLLCYVAELSRAIARVAVIFANAIFQSHV